MREDYSADGDAWNYFPHDHARSRAYRWSEDGLAGFCDDRQTICLAVALWNEKDAFLKERPFGLSNQEGNHGEDVKEYYFHLDGTPTHSYMKMVYKYPQVAFPYEALVETNRARGQGQPEFELFDAMPDVFTANRYFDVFVEYAKANPEDILCHITVVNRGPEPAPIHVLPHLWYRNTWSWRLDGERRVIQRVGPGAAHTSHDLIGERWWYARAGGNPVELLFTENETNRQRLFGAPNPEPYVKDGIDQAVVHGNAGAVNSQRGSKLAGHAHTVLAPGASFSVAVRFCAEPHDDPFGDFAAVMALRASEADAFYAALHPPSLDAEERKIQRQALAGLLWTKQFYHYDVYTWLLGDPSQPAPPPERWHGRNRKWKALLNSHVILMPDKWEYPWYASWDLAFHCVAMAYIDPAFAKAQLLLMGDAGYQNVSGQFPAYEWDFDDVNPPVLGWAAWQVYRIERDRTGRGDLEFLRQMFDCELLCFNFWVNRKDAQRPRRVRGRVPRHGQHRVLRPRQAAARRRPARAERRHQLDGALLPHDAQHRRRARPPRPGLSELVHPVLRALPLHRPRHDQHGRRGDRPLGRRGPVLLRRRAPDVGKEHPDQDALDGGPGAALRRARAPARRRRRASIASSPAPRTSSTGGRACSRTWRRWACPEMARLSSSSVLGAERLLAVLRRMLDPAEFLSDYGIRSVSRHHLAHPYVFTAAGQQFEVKYLPAESDNRLFGGNSNWRGPIWFPVNYMIVRSLHEFGRYHGDRLKVECPTGSGRWRTLEQVGADIAGRLVSIFLPDPGRGGRRPVWGDNDVLPDRPALARLHAVPRVLQRRYRRRPRGEPSDGVDGPGRRAPVRVRRTRPRCLRQPPGRSYPVGATVERGRRELLRLLRSTRRRSSCCCSTDAADARRPR